MVVVIIWHRLDSIGFDKFKVVLMAFTLFWHQLDNIYTKDILLLSAMHVINKTFYNGKLVLIDEV